VHQEDESSFLATFNKAISNPQSLKEMGNKARQTAMSYEWSYVVERIENIFQTISSQLMN